MVIPGLVLIIVAIVLVWLMSRRRLTARTRSPQASLASSDGEAPFPAARRDTALQQLRDLRDALKPAEHMRTERRRAGGAGPYVGPERRRAAAQSLSRQRPHGLPDEGVPLRDKSRAQASGPCSRSDG